MTKRKKVIIASALFLLMAISLLIIIIYANQIENPLPANIQADKIYVEKSRHRLSLIKQGRIIKTYRIALGRSPAGNKVQEGDNRTPEGLYKIDYHNPQSGWHLSLHISYPDEAAKLRAKSLSVDPGGLIMIHGIKDELAWVGKLHRLFDWTRGCIAVTNPEIEEIWRAVPDNTPIEIVP